MSEGEAPAVYAHVVGDPSHPGELALQYWLFYAYNDWNNLHEGDWEMIQLVFEAEDAAAALEVEPTRVGYSQHEGAEQAEWGEDKLELVDGTHPVVHPAAGSHANFYEEGLYLGSSAEQGSAATTRADRPSTCVRPWSRSRATRTPPRTPIPGSTTRAGLQRAFFNGPTGPNLKTQWTEPITWSEGWRDQSYAVPAGGALGTGATDFFCDAIAGGSKALQRALDNPPVVLGVLAVAPTCRPPRLAGDVDSVDPLRLARRRAWGQILATSLRMYWRRPGLFLGIGLVMLPISIVVAVLQALITGAAGFAGIDADGEGATLLVLLVVALLTTLTLAGVGLVQAAAARPGRSRRGPPSWAGRRLPARARQREAAAGRARNRGHRRLAADNVRDPDPHRRLARRVLGPDRADRRARDPLGARCPAAKRQARPLELVEGRHPGDRRRRARACRRPCPRRASHPPARRALALANVIAGLVYVVAMPFVALSTVYVYFDARVRDELAPIGTDVLPAEIDLASG